MLLKTTNVGTTTILYSDAHLESTVISTRSVLQSDITEAKELPKPPDPEITRMEYDMKDQLIRQTIMSTQEDVKEIKDQMIRVEDKIDKLK